MAAGSFFFKIFIEKFCNVNWRLTIWPVVFDRIYMTSANVLRHPRGTAAIRTAGEDEA